MPRLVALDLPWDDGFVRALEQAWAAGDAVAPLDPRLPPPAARELVAAIGPTHVIGPDGERVAVDGGLPTEPGDALVVATSGSRAAPKAVVLTEVAVRESAEQTSRRLEVDPGRDKWLACIPLSHVGGLGVVTRSVITGTPLVVHERFDARRVELEAAAHGVTLVSLVAAALARVDASLFRTVLLGGAAPPAGLPANVVTTYGMTETCGGVVYDGVPLDGIEVAVDEGARRWRKRRNRRRGAREGADAAQGVPGRNRSEASRGLARDRRRRTHRRPADASTCRGGSPRRSTPAARRFGPPRSNEVIADAPQGRRGGRLRTARPRMGRAGRRLRGAEGPVRPGRVGRAQVAGGGAAGAVGGAARARGRGCVTPDRVRERSLAACFLSSRF